MNTTPSSRKAAHTPASEPLAKSAAQIPPLKTRGLARFYHATRYSLQGLKTAYQTEPAFRYETWCALALLPAAFWLASSPLHWALLISSLLFVLIMELINTAIEAIVDRAGREYHELAGLAKDLGSAAVLFALFIALLCWGSSLWSRLLV
ncbi:diacylglycerol kinase [Nitrincola tapanii]|uniref:Diacylglycerol kinase n=1 Tax=Nitrincola tapanii TaxID=1708751 RepID=A0A5A9W318_9GAMM|nr:diacylglycerol kinase [Nitrincola tapanii]KAA0875087.1 diacylglycerol kinase [Nitrincola tapanii]